MKIKDRKSIWKVQIYSQDSCQVLAFGTSGEGLSPMEQLLYSKISHLSHLNMINIPNYVVTINIYQR